MMTIAAKIGGGRWAAFAAGLLLLPATASGAPGRELPGCTPVMPSFAARITGLPPHQSWQLPNNARREWAPIAVDRHYVLMDWEKGNNPQDFRHSLDPQALRMALVRVGSRTLQPIAAGAYPHYGILLRWQIEYPWIVGLKYNNPAGPLDWVLWAGNVVTGRHIILDHAVLKNGVPAHTPPEDSLDRGRVAWDMVVRTPFTNVVHSKIALYDLNRNQESLYAPSQSGVFYEQPALDGNTVVWVSITPQPRPMKHGTYDLLKLDLTSGQVVNLTHNWETATGSSGESLEPSLWSHYLVFKQTPSPWSMGDIVLWDLNAGHYPLWRDHQHAAVLDAYGRDGGGERPLLGTGIAAWDAGGQVTSSVLDMTRDTIWTLQDPWKMAHGHYRYVWQLFDTQVGGRNVIARRDISRNRSQPVFFVWHILPARSHCAP